MFFSASLRDVFSKTSRFLWLSLFIAVALPSLAFGAQLRDLGSVSGVRTNQLIGFGLVVGLDGSGDQTTQTPFTLQT
ncbi:MAG: flagellar biosynthesis protein FlgI, partial [Betaproteobacteria bacterium]|nr:flagellar biosynthesis protein FlgI [Betaproteobacteria bacterium]